MKKALLTLAVILCALATLAPGIGPGAGGPIGPSPGGGGFVGGTITTPILGANGTAAAPTFGFSGDAGNGMYLKGADDLGFSAGGVERCDMSTTLLTCTGFSGPLTGNASTATALANNPTDCGANTFATAIAANGNLTCTQPAVANISDIASTYCALAGCTMSGAVIPNADGTVDFGSGAASWKDGYFDGDLVVGDDLTCNQATMTVNAITALAAPAAATTSASDGILLRNTTAAGAAQEFSPSLRLDGTGYTAAATYNRQTWLITNKPTSATAGKIALDFSSAVGVPAEKFSVDQGGNVTVAGNLVGLDAVRFSNGSGRLESGATFGSGTGGFLKAEGAAPMGIAGYIATAATAIAVQIGNMTTLLTTEGARLVGFFNTTVLKAAIDKDGAYHQGYASGQVTDAVPSLALTLVTAMDDDTIYDVTVGCQYIGYAAGAVGTPTYHFSSVIGASLIRIDGVASEVGTNTTISHKEDASAACVPCAVSFTNGATDTITATFTQCHLDADVANVKAWIKSMTKTNITTFVGVAQPAAN